MYIIDSDKRKDEIMKRRKIVSLLFIACAIASAGLLSGCGANLNREITVQDMIIEVPSDWLETLGPDNDEESGAFFFAEESDDLDDDETPNTIAIDYRALDDDSEDDEGPLSASEAMAVKRADTEREFGVTAWDIDKEKSKVIDGAQVTTYEYSFVKEIEGVRRTYEYATAYVFTIDTVYEISVTGGKVDINKLVDTIEF